jgi:hypothetical protein
MKRYLWWYKNRYHFDCQYKGINLCPYVRAVVFWYTLRQIFRDGWEKALAGYLTLYAMVSALIYRLAGSKGLKIEAIVTAIIIALVASVIGISLLVEYSVECSHRRREAKYRAMQQGVIEEDPGPSFFTIVWDVLVKAHDKVCPYVPINK